jgi:hypothetical protein
MATAILSTAFAYNDVSQDLFTISTTPEGTTQYTSLGNNVPLVFNTVATNLGTNISIDDATGEITLQPGTYTLVALAQAGGTGGSSALNGATYGFINEAGPYADSITQTIGTPLTTNLTLASETILQVILTGHNGNSFQYPDQVVNASINIQSSTYTY